MRTSTDICTLIPNYTRTLETIQQPAPKAKNNFTQRIITGLCIAAAATVSVWKSPFGLLLLITLVGTLSLWELLTMAAIEKKYKILAEVLFAVILVGLGLEMVGLVKEFPVFAVLFLGLPLIGVLHLGQTEFDHTFDTISRWIMAVIYIVVPLILFVRISYITTGEYQFWVPLGLMVLNYLMDSFAYFTGRLFGKTPLAPTISPKKTWEGVIGGALFCIAAGIIFQLYLPNIGVNWLIITTIIVLLNQPGDLIESLFKRSTHIKDSGNILPGHGGMLDRFDSLLTIIPVIYFYLSLK